MKWDEILSAIIALPLGWWIGGVLVAAWAGVP